MNGLCSPAVSALDLRLRGLKISEMYSLKCCEMRHRLCDNGLVKRASGRMHIDNASRQYVTAGGERRISRCFLLRRSFRDQNGRPRNETLANLSALPDHVIAALGKTLKGAALVDAEDALEVERSVPHGNAAAAHVMASKLGLRALLGPPCRERDIAYALILSRAVRPESKLSTATWWGSGDTTLGADLSVAGASTDEVYAAMDWLAGRQREIEKQLAARHLRENGIAMSRPVFLMGGGEMLRAGGVRAFPRRQARPQADRVRAAHLPAGKAGRGRGVSRQRF